MANYARFGDTVTVGGGISATYDPASGVSISVTPAGPSTSPAGSPPPPPAPTANLPVASMAVVGLAGYLLGKKRGEAGLWTAVGAGLGYYFRPIG